jgi:phosphoribosylglycinamide formyltransferase-1
MDGRRTSPRIAVLCSGRGTNLQAIIRAIRAGRLHARIAVVISDRADAWALTRAKRAGLQAACVAPKRFPTRERFERHLIKLLEAHRVRLVCLAGFMRVLSPVFVRRFAHRILNIHPALLPAFPGSHAIRDALAWGVKVTGVTVHLVDEQVDHGPIVLQEALAIRPGETEASLLKRVHRIEHRLYPRAIQLMLDGRARLKGRRVIIAGVQRKISRRVFGRNTLRPVAGWMSRIASKVSKR